MEPMQIEEDRPRRLNWHQFFTMDNVREKAFLFVVAIFGVLSLALFISAISHHQAEVRRLNICQTVECIKASNHILSFINQTADPCDDFYKFACGNFHKNYVEKQKQNDLEEMEDVLERTLDQLLIGDSIDDSNFTVNLKIARKFYKACMNTTAIREDQDSTFLGILNNVTGGWPTKDNRSLKKNFWQNITLKAREYGARFDFFLNVSVGLAPDSSAMLLIAPPAIETFWFNALWNINNIQYFQQIAKYWNRADSYIYLNTEKTLEFANKLYEIITDSNGDIEFMDDDERIRPISQLNQTKYFDLDWLNFLQNLTGIQSLKKTDKVLYLMYGDSKDNYLKRLHALIQNADESVWINYIIISNIMENCRLLSEEIQAVCFKMMPMWEASPRDEYCRDFTQSQFIGEQDREYIKQTSPIEKRNHVQAMISDLKKTLETSLLNIPLLNKKTKKGALGQLKNLTTVIGSGDIMFNNTLYKEQYGEVVMNVSNNVIQMYFKIKKIEMDFSFNLTGRQAPNKHAKEMHVPTLGANMYFSPNHNVLFVPAPIIQEPIYEENRPQYLNYGLLGTIIGHELIHALLYPDVILEQFRNRENRWEFDLWKYRQTSVKCEYNKYLNYLEERRLSTDTVPFAMDESYADFGGINVAYKAYQNWQRQHGDEQILPGVNYTANQIFWIVSSIYLCYDTSVDDPEKIREYLNSDDRYNYPIPSYRINGPRRNSPYFAKDFKCKAATKMNPTDKCETFA